MSLTLCAFLFALPAISALECVPSTCVVNVVESGKYTFGVKPDASVNITKCAYRSDTGISGSFLISSPANNSLKRTTKNLVSNLGNIGLCQISVENVDDKGPKSWTLRPSNEQTQQNFKELNFTVNFFYKAVSLSDIVNVLEGESFYQYINSTIRFQSCKLKIGDTEIDLDVNAQQDGSIDERISSLGNGLCGFVFSNASLEDPSNWSLVGTNSEDKSYEADFKLNVFVRPSIKDTHTKKIVVIGSDVAIKCGDEHNQDFCYLYDPQGDFVTSNIDCSYNIKTVALHHLGTWKCRVGKFPAVETLEYSVELTASESASVRQWRTENDKYINIGCQLINYGKISGCRMIAPSTQVFNLGPGAAYGRYLAFGTNFENSSCALTIKKPLDYNNDKGQWRCEIHTGSTRTGAFISVDNFSPPSYNTYKTIMTQLGEKLKVQCDVPFSSEYCYIKSPDDTKYLMPNNFDSRLGICSVNIEHVEPKHVGLWNCYFAQKTGIPDEKITVNVTIAELLLFTTKVEEQSGGNATLMCSSHGLPLNYCRFVAPNSLSYFIEDYQNSSRISYKGRGLKYGECGITITNAQTSDSGIWRCITRVGTDYKQNEVFADIDLYIAPTFLENPAALAGFATACVVLVISGLAFFGYRLWRRQRPSLSSFDSRSTQESSREEIFNNIYPSYSNMRHNSDDHAD